MCLVIKDLSKADVKTMTSLLERNKVGFCLHGEGRVNARAAPTRALIE